MLENGLMNGVSVTEFAPNAPMSCGRPDGAFDPYSGATRAEAAAMLHRYAEAVK
jgi:hypothetical protein